MKLHIIRGLPGSGKTTYVNSNFTLGIKSGGKWLDFFEADMFFTSYLGDYNWSKDFLYEAHRWCYLNVLRELYIKHDVIVANTFITLKELQPYLDLKQRFPDLEIVIYELHTQFKSIHNVPDSTLEHMKARWVDLPESDDYQLVRVYSND